MEESHQSWSIQYKDGLLTITWHEFFANCGVLGFSTWIDIVDDSIIEFKAKSIEDELPADCECTYNVTSAFENVKPGHYTISFYYADDWYCNEIFTADVDITEGCDITLTEASAGVCAISNDNPAVSLSPDGIIHIASGDTASLEIYDASGTLRTRLNATPNSDIDITNLRKGIYIAKITTGGQVSTLRFAR